MLADYINLGDMTPKQFFFLLGLAILSLLFLSYPLISLLGAVDLNVLSIFEFYFIDLMTHPLEAELGQTKLTDAIPFKGSLSDINVLSYFLPESVQDCLDPILNFIGMYFERIDAVLGGAFIFVLGEILGLTGYLYSPTKMLLLIPLVVALVASPVNLLYLPFTAVAFTTALLTISIGSLVASVIFNRPLYQYLRIESLLYSIAFATLTDMAFICIQGMNAVVLGYALYAVTLLPLIYFAYRAYTADFGEDMQWLAYLGYMVGTMSLVMHVVEAAYTVLGAMGYKRCKVIADVLHSEPVQATVLGITTAMSGLCVFDQVNDEKYQLVDPIASAA